MPLQEWTWFRTSFANLSLFRVLSLFLMLDIFYSKHILNYESWQHFDSTSSIFWSKLSNNHKQMIINNLIQHNQTPKHRSHYKSNKNTKHLVTITYRTKTTCSKAKPFIKSSSYSSSPSPSPCPTSSPSSYRWLSSTTYRTYSFIFSSTYTR
jgi:hypothetical protein